MDGHESDPVQLYLAQMGDVPLLSREEEQHLAQRIEKTRDRFRRKLLATDLMLQAGAEMMQKMLSGKMRWKTRWYPQFPIWRNVSGFWPYCNLICIRYPT